MRSDPRCSSVLVLSLLTVSRLSEATSNQNPLNLEDIEATWNLSGDGFPATRIVAPGDFPTSLFPTYFNDPSPTETTEQVQPVVTDPALGIVYPLELTHPDTIPQNNSVDRFPLPGRASDEKIVSHFVETIATLAASDSLDESPFTDGVCARCQAALISLKAIALAVPSQGHLGTEAFCRAFKLSTDCSLHFGSSGLGSILTQVLPFANPAGYDGQSLCAKFIDACPRPPASKLDLSNWFSKPKPSVLPSPRRPSGTRVKVLHLSDFHLDPRYKTGAEAECTSGFCCRNGARNEAHPNDTVYPAPRFGSYLCDTPFALAAASLQAISSAAWKTGFDFTIYTGDLVSHDVDNQLSRAYALYTETAVFQMFKKLLKTGPLYASLGNHDSYPNSQEAPHSLGGELGDQFSWNYDHVANLWQHHGWLSEPTAKVARAHYGAYMVRRPDGLRIITLNTDFWYRDNFFNYINMTDPDVSGMLRFLTDELQNAEDAGDRVWIIGHVPSGWSNVEALENPTNLFYQIADRFSPHVIANIFWGHTHEDHFNIYYSDNGSVRNASTAQAVSWIGPSLTPLPRLNSGFRVYEVDSSTFDILDSYTWISDVSTYAELDNPNPTYLKNQSKGPVFELEYSARDLYGAYVPDWGENDPLNATWWHKVTEAMERNATLVNTFNFLQGKSVKSYTTNCTSKECVEAKICYMRSASTSLARECIPGYGRHV